MELYLFVFFGGFGIILSFIGLGYILNFLFFPKKYFDPGMQAIFGLSLFLIIGGYLNLFKVISKVSLLGFLLIGLCAAFFLFIKNRKIISKYLLNVLVDFRKNKKLAVLLIFCIALILFRYALSVSFFGFHGTDDAHAYMVFPAKMIQTGHLGDDPFSERRVVSSLGGGYLLNAAVLSFASFKNLHLVDNGIGFILLILLLAGHLKKLNFNKEKILFLVLLVVLIPSPSGNITSFFLAAALFFSLFRILHSKEELRDFQSVLITSLITIPLILLKTNLVAPALILFCYHFVSLYYQKNTKIWLLNFILTAVLFSISLSPWMISMHQSSGTLFYPFLGKGYFNDSYNFLFLNFYGAMRLVSELLAGLSLFLPLAILGYLVFCSDIPKKRLLIYILFSCLSGIAAIIYGIGGYSLYYYSFPFILPAVLILLVSLLDGKSRIYAIMVVVFMMGVFMQKNIDFLTEFKNNLSFDGGVKIGLANTDLVSFEDLLRYKNLQSSVPPNETILSRLDRNFLLNFKRNNIFIIDLPGGASLPPGLPFRQGSDKLADYLLSVGIKYVAYSYGNEANFSRAIDSGMLREHVNPWLKAQTERSFDFQDNLAELGKKRKVIYDDGKNFVLDLSIKK